jgi:hypothetical protein
MSTAFEYLLVPLGDCAQLDRYDRGRKTGPLLQTKAFHTLTDALVWLEKRITAPPDENGKTSYMLDVEDDCIRIYNFDDTGNPHLVWEFAGCHYDDQLGIPGHLLGHKRSLCQELWDEIEQMEEEYENQELTDAQKAQLRKIVDEVRDIGKISIG